MIVKRSYRSIIYKIDDEFQPKKIFQKWSYCIDVKKLKPISDTFWGRLTGLY